MRITVSDIYPLSSEQILKDLTIRELTTVIGGYRRQRTLPGNIETQLQEWRVELNTMRNRLR
ncbi:hypothetical protein FJR11_01070 [Anabaena sp. UHCC 0187]|nr:hypothetical protein [Anabaena sp. UHCC 0187]